MARKKTEEEKRRERTSLLTRLFQPFAEIGANLGVAGQAIFDPEVRRVISDPERAGRTMTGGQLRAAEQKLLKPHQTLGFSEEDARRLLEETTEDPLLKSAKLTAGTLAYGVPGGGATRTARVGKSLAGGALSGFGSSERGEEIGSTIAGAGTSAVAGEVLNKALTRLAGRRTGKQITQETLDELLGRTGGQVGESVGDGAGILSKTLGKGREFGEDLVESARVKAFGGKPGKGLKGVQLFKQLDDIGLNTTSQEGLQKGVDDIFRRHAGVIDDAANKLSERGVKIDSDSVLSWAKKKQGTAKTSLQKDQWGSVVDTLKSNFDEFGDDAATALAQRRDYSKQGNFNPFSATNTEKDIAGKWNMAYEKINAALDNAFKKEGFEEFRKINNELHVATKAENFLEDLAQKGAKGQGIGLRDVAAAGAGFGAGGPVVAGGAVLATRLANNPRAQIAAGNLLQRLPEGGINIPQLPQSINELVEQAGQQLTRPAVTSNLTKMIPQLAGALPPEEVQEAEVQELSPALESTQGLEALSASASQMKDEGMGAGEIAQFFRSQGIGEQAIDDILTPLGASRIAEAPTGDGRPQTGFNLPPETKQTLAVIQMLASAGIPSDVLAPLLIDALLPEGGDGQSAFSNVIAAGGGDLLDQGTADEREAVAQQIQAVGLDEYRQQAPIEQLYTKKEQEASDEAGEILSEVDSLISTFEGGEDLTGLFSGGLLARGGRAIGIGDDSPAAAAQAALSTYSNKFIKDISGANVTAPEEKRLASSVPKVTDTEETVLIKLENIRNKTARDEAVREGAKRMNVSTTKFWNQQG